MTEPGGGSDLASLKTTAVRDGDDWVINGSKTFITNGGSADLVVVAARTAPEKKAKGISLFGVDTSLPGFSVGRVLDKVGQDESDTAELVTKVEVTQAFVDQCVLKHTRGELTAVDAAKAKWWTSQVQNDVLDHCVQLHGGYGYMNEYRVARAWRDARVSKIWAGSNEIMKMLIGRDLGL